jgi:hypothetical protein
MKRSSHRLMIVRLLLVAFAELACSERAATRAVWDGGSALAAPLGVWVPAHGYELRVIAVRSCAAPDAGAAGADRRRVALEVELTATGDSRVPVNSFYARLVDEEGRALAPVMRGCEPALRRAPLARGQTARGLWTFDLTSPPRRLDLVYRPRLLDPAQDTTTRVAVGSL